jgi:branched-chain amino acid transport system substrate-binding protein
MTVAVATIALTAACSSQGVNSPGDANQTPKDKIVIAVSSPESGAGAYAAAYTRGIQAYISYLNDKGGVNGYTFGTTIVDNAGTAAGGAQALRQILQSKPFIVAVIGSSSFQASVDIVKDQAPTLPIVNFGNAALVRSAGLANAFGFFTDYSRECRFQVDFAKNNLHAKNVALLYENSAIGQGPSADCPGYATSQGLTMQSYAVPTPTVSTNYSPIIAQVGAQKPDATLFFGSNTELVGLQKSAQGIGLATKWVSLVTSFDITYFGLAGTAAEGTYFDAIAQPIDSTSAEADLFRTQMQKYAPNSVNTLAGYGWSYGAVIERAVKAATDGGKALTTDSFVAALKTPNTDPAGLLYSADYSKDVSTVASSLSVYQAQGGKFVRVVDSAPVPALS